jgi:chromosome segregation protein
MRLKRIKIFGFKTFADRTTFDLDGDLIAVVGPNGCGKSNIVDAILWGLGEPNARQLRAANSQEIIFSGSSKRKPVNVAEVTLIFDNEDRALNVDSTEVSITRRLDRSGDSDFEINGHRCRLKDIYDLLADSGLGRSGYSIVGQKEIDAALAASAEDRRAWIDEAAGVQRYRAKRSESLRRLSQTSEHLSRIEDILTEIETQRAPLEREAEVAERYRTAKSALREVEVGLMSRDVATAVQQLQQIEERLTTTKRAAEDESTLAAKLDAEAAELGEELSEIERELDALRTLHQSAISERERCVAHAEKLAQALAHFDELEANLSDDESHADERRGQLQEDFAAISEETKALRSALETIQDSAFGAGQEAEQCRKELGELDARLERARKLQQQKLEFEAQRAARADQKKSLKIELKGLQESLPELESAIAEAQSALDEAVELRKGLETKRQSLLQAVKEARSGADHLDHQRRAALQQKAVLEGRIRGIEATLHAHEGVTQGARAVLAAAERGILSHSYVAVGDAVHTDADLALAIETALGGSANDLIVESDSHAKQAIQWLNENRLGRATFQPVNLMRANYRRHELDALKRERGVIGVASDLVRCEDRHRPVIESLLGRVLIVETLDDSLRLAKTQGWSRMVTLDGELVHSSGAVTGGVHAKQSTGMVQRRAELDEATRELEKLEGVLRSIDKKAAAESNLPELQSQVEQIETELREYESELRDRERWHHNLATEHQQSVRSVTKIEAELAKLSEPVAESQEAESIPELEKQRDEVLQKAASRAANAQTAVDAMREAEARLKIAADREEELRRRIERESSGQEARESRLATINRDREQTHKALTQAGTDQEEIGQRIEIHRGRLEATTERRTQLLDANFHVTEQAKEAHGRKQTAQEIIHRVELERANVDAKRAAAQERLLEEFGMLEAEAIAHFETHSVPEGAAGIAANLRREIKGMGEVNVGAIEAFARLNERFVELKHQYDDVDSSKAEIEAGIRELDKLTRDRFRTTFEAVAHEFKDTFQRLFGGGEGRILLTNPEDLLLTGVDIEVEIPGKKKQRLELLSGGERALAASAFLFALLRVKPSPLVVLDEVDAPLDGRNVERFVQAMKEFEGRTQFICITHNPLTIESAPIWFGVTMQEPGVSTVIPYRATPSPQLSSA